MSNPAIKGGTCFSLSGTREINIVRLIGFILLCCGVATAQNCDFKEYKALDGLKASMNGSVLEVAWSGDHGQQLRASFAIRDGQPMVHELAARKGQGAWIVLGRDLTPEFEVLSGVRRLSDQQVGPLKLLNVAISPAVIEKEKWNAFWDAPLNVPGTGSVGLPRKAEEIRRASATYRADACAVKSDGARLEVTYPGLEMGIFSGQLRFTVYRGTNLLRQEAIAKTEEPSVAYKYVAGLKGFTIADDSRIVWRDPARAWQEYGFGGSVNKDSVALKARNRLAILEAGGGSLAFFPPSHKFFFARELETNLGFVYYRKFNDSTFAIGARQAEREEPYKPYGISDAVWERRENEARHDTNNFALYNA